MAPETAVLPRQRFKWLQPTRLNLSRVAEWGRDEAKKWSIAHFVFDAALTALVTYAIRKASAVGWWETAFLAASLFVLFLSGFRVVIWHREQRASPGRTPSSNPGFTATIDELIEEGRNTSDDAVWLKSVAAALTAMLDDEEVNHQFWGSLEEAWKEHPSDRIAIAIRFLQGLKHRLDIDRRRQAAGVP